MLFKQDIDPTKQSEPSKLLRPFIAAWHWLAPPSQAHADRQTETSRRLRAALIIAVGGGFIFTALFKGRDFRDAWRDWRAERLVTEAKRQMEEGNPINAFFNAQEAYTLSPKNENALRMNAEILVQGGREESLYFTEVLEKEGYATTRDRQLRVKAFIKLNRTKEASELLEKIMRDSPPNDEMFKLAEEVWTGKQQGTTIVRVLGEYCAQHPDDLESALRLARFQIASDDGPEFAHGLSILWKMAANDDDIGLRAIETLDSVKDIPPEDIGRLVTRLEEHPKADARHYVASLKRRIQMSQSSRARLISEAVKKYQSASRADRVPLVRWLVEEREFLHVAALVDEEDAKKEQQLLENYLTALTMLGRNDDLLRIVNDPAIAPILHPALIAFYQAHLAFVTGKPRDIIRERLIIAKVAADDEKRGMMLMALGDYCEKRLFLDVAEDAYKAAITHMKTERKGYEGLIRCTRGNGNTDGMLAATRAAKERWLDDDYFLEQYFYVSLVAGREVELSLERSLALREKRPEDSATKLTSALGYYRIGDLDMAINHLQGIDLNKCDLGQRAVFAFLAKLGGFQEAVDRTLQSMPANPQLLPQEMHFLLEARKSVVIPKETASGP